MTHMILHLRKYIDIRVRVPLPRHRSSLETSPETVVSRNHKQYSAVSLYSCAHMVALRACGQTHVERFSYIKGVVP